MVEAALSQARRGGIGMKQPLSYAEYKDVMYASTKPKSYAELLQAVKCELAMKVMELEERAVAVSELFRRLEDVLDAGGQGGGWDHGVYCDAADHSDLDGLRRLQELFSNWPDVKGKPGEGYW